MFDILRFDTMNMSQKGNSILPWTLANELEDLETLNGKSISVASFSFPPYEKELWFKIRGMEWGT